MKVWNSKIWVFPSLSLPNRALIRHCKIVIYGTQIHKVLVFFVLSSTTVREVNYFFIICGWLALINKDCFNLIQNACVIVFVIRTETQ